MAMKKTAQKSAKTASESKAAAKSGAKTGKPATERRHEGAAMGEKKRTTRPKAAAATKPAASVAEKPDNSPAGILARAEADMSKLLESLNTQMSVAMHAFTELAAVHRGRREAVIRTKPLDRATAMFQRLVMEVMDERFEEIVPLLVALRLEMGQRAQNGGNGADSSTVEFLTRGTQMLDQVLANAEVRPYECRVGDAFDPLIHLAVGETGQPDLADGIVSEVLGQGFRTSRGKVIQAARVKVNRR